MTEVEANLLVSSASAVWIEEVCSGLSGDGRVLEGGWPGTLSEARLRMQKQAHRTDILLTSNQCMDLARVLYHDAKVQWTRRAKRSRPVVLLEGVE